MLNSYTKLLEFYGNYNIFLKLIQYVSNIYDQV